MKTIINNNEIDGKTHPYLAICDNGTIVIFTKKDTGICLHSSLEELIFAHTEENFWEEDNFKIFNGTITLSNK